MGGRDGSRCERLETALEEKWRKHDLHFSMEFQVWTDGKRKGCCSFTGLTVYTTLIECYPLPSGLSGKAKHIRYTHMKQWVLKS